MKFKRLIIVIIVFIVLLGFVSFKNDFISEKIKSFICPQVTVLGEKFGIVTGYRGDIPKIKETRSIALKDGVNFGWIIVTKEADKDLRWREVFVFPEKPKNLTVTGETKISSGGRKAITERSSSLKEGIIYNTWGLERGDPLGKYKIKIYTPQGLIKEFSFEVR
ncbi:MAG: hypothetical protein K9L95_02910 [Candidatus Omnitrophica bacterium]|nr:hypothetical protein [Candidatus Omnitrophota bacterium]MCF7877158.1 hypothetical protein [Candidatus Omnitrophota bacterium]MCF7878405.1 hypothetical protein [Candidatus Omnitrophota bacterium]MCF7893409.1 hypothetical protein [Candidatus Omnitrophota bacterium]